MQYLVEQQLQQEVPVHSHAHDLGIKSQTEHLGSSRMLSHTYLTFPVVQLRA